MYRLPERGPGTRALAPSFPWRSTSLALGTFAALALVVVSGARPWLERLDVAASEAVRAAPPPLLDTAALAATLLGDFPLTTSLMLALVVLLLASGRIALALHAAWLFFLTKLAVAATKLALARARPLALYEGGDSYAFPSGHATSAAVLLGAIAALFLARRAAVPLRAVDGARTGIELAEGARSARVRGRRGARAGRARRRLLARAARRALAVRRSSPGSRSVRG